MIQICPPPLSKGIVHTWLAELDRPPEEQDELAQHLSWNERERAARLIDSHRRERFSTGRGLLRVILAAYLSTPPHKIQFSYGAKGKPYLEHNVKTPLYFNLSHSGNRIMIAITLENEIGVDIEEINPIENLEIISHRYFSIRESQIINTLPPQEQVNAFFTCWTRKEAFVKGCGGGFSIPLDSFSVSLNSEESEPLLDLTCAKDAQRGWRIIPLSPAQGYTGALAVQCRPTLHHFFIPS